MFRLLLCMSVVLVVSAVGQDRDASAQPLVPKTGQTVLLNGFFSEGEWAEASRVNPVDGIEIYAQQNDKYLFIGIKTLDASHTGLNFYLATGAHQQILFHVSSALAEATFDGEKWSEWRWEKNRRWVANKIGLYQDGDTRLSSEPEGFEFQIDKSMWSGDVIHLALHLKRPEFEYPPQQEREAFRNWIPLQIGE